MTRVLRLFLIVFISYLLIFLPPFFLPDAKADEASVLPVGDIIAPVITRIPITTKKRPGERASIPVIVTDNVGVKDVTVYYRNIGAVNYRRAEMVRILATDEFSVMLPELSVPAVEYYIQATDYGGNTVFLGHSFSPLTLTVSTDASSQEKPVERIVDKPEITETPQLKSDTLSQDPGVPDVQGRRPDPPVVGPRLAVSEFRMHGLDEYPQWGITRETLGKMVEEIRIDLMDGGEFLPSSYAINKSEESSDATPSDLQKWVWVIKGQRSKRGILLSQIESIAEKITRFYRERGFMLAKAYIAKKRKRDGVVNFALLIGVLGEVNTHGSQLYSHNAIKSVFDDMLSLPVTHSAVDESLYLLNDFPGVTAVGYFEPGYQVGEARLNINIKNEDRYRANLRLDNYGTDKTGLYRQYADVQVNNTLGVADFFKASVLNASSPNNTKYWRLNYQMNLMSPRFKIGLGAAKNQFIVDQSSGLSKLNLDGTVNIQDIWMRYVFRRSRIKNYNLALTYEKMESDLQVGGIEDIGAALDERLANTSLQFNYDILSESARILHQGDVKLTSGKFLFGVNVGQDKNYNILSTQYTALMFWRIPYFKENTQLIFRTSAQYAGTNVSTLLRFSAAGLTRVRGEAPDTFSSDDAVYAGVDWVFSSPDFLGMTLQKWIKPVVFADYTYGKQYSIIDEKDVTGKLSDVGVGLRLAYGVKFKGNLQFAFPINSRFSNSDIELEKKSVRVLFDFQYGF